MARAPFVLPTGTYCLAHLEPFPLVVGADDPTLHDVRLLVNFTHHTFSEKWVPGVSAQSHYLI